MGMPTAAKLFAAIMFAGLAYALAWFYTQNLPSNRPPGWLREIGALIGLICGWSIMGAFATKPKGRIEAMGTGVRTSFTIALFLLVVMAIAEMLSQAMRGRYDSPMDAFLAIFSLTLSFGKGMLTPEILSMLLLGGLLGGAGAHWVGRNWR